MTSYTVETLSGDNRPINIDQVTHLTALAFGTQVHFASGEPLLVAKSVSELTLDMLQAATVQP